MARRTVYLPDSVDALVRRVAREGESYSSALARLVEAGEGALRDGEATAGDSGDGNGEPRRSRRAPSYVTLSEGPEEADAPDDLGLRAERYLRDLVRSAPGTAAEDDAA